MVAVATDVFDTADVDGIVAQQHFEYETRRERDYYLADPSEVADYAESIARKYYGKRQRGVTSLGAIVFATYAAKLVYSMDHYGMSFLDVCRTATIGVAKIIAQISADPRSNFVDRYRDQLNRLQRKAGDEAQIVRMAEIIASAKRLLDPLAFSRERALAERENILPWIRHQDAQLDRLKKRLFANERLTPAVTRADELIDAVFSKIRKPRVRSGELSTLSVVTGSGENQTAIPAALLPVGWYSGPDLDNADETANPVGFAALADAIA